MLTITLSELEELLLKKIVLTEKIKKAEKEKLYIQTAETYEEVARSILLERLREIDRLQEERGE